MSVSGNGFSHSYWSEATRQKKKLGWWSLWFLPELWRVCFFLIGLKIACPLFVDWSLSLFWAAVFLSGISVRLSPPIEKNAPLWTTPCFSSTILNWLYLLLAALAWTSAKVNRLSFDFQWFVFVLVSMWTVIITVTMDFHPQGFFFVFFFSSFISTAVYFSDHLLHSSVFSNPVVGVFFFCGCVTHCPFTP